MLGPDDVRARKFTTVRGFKEGYNMAEVDVFLEQVCVTLAEAQEELGQLRSQAPSQTAASLLEIAERTAAEHVARAQSEAAAQIAALQHQVEALNARIAELQQIEATYRARLKEFISSHLDEL